ncbi:MAG: single-strand DNA-binding protein, partial [Arenicella sp.]
YVKQGDMIYVEGRIKTDTWQDDQGNNRKRTKIRVTTMTMMPRGSGNKNQEGESNSGGNNNGGNMQQNSSTPKVSEPDPLSTASSDGGNDIDDLPF